MDCDWSILETYDFATAIVDDPLQFFYGQLSLNAAYDD